MSVTLQPASLSARIAAGAVDTGVIVVLSALSFLVPLLLRGVVLPMWGVLAVMVGYSVVPLAFLQQTLGMRLFGLELCTRDGHPVDLANLLFRELLGRGFFPAAYLFTLLVALVARLLGVAGTAAPVVLTGIMTLASMGALAVAIVGHLTALSRPDQRTLADLMSGSFVVLGPARPPSADVEEAEERLAHRRRVVRNVVVFEVVLALLVVAVPWVLSSSSGESPKQRIARLRLEALESKFQADPGNEGLATDLLREHLRAGRRDDVKRVEAAHQAALAKKEAQREADLRKDLETHSDRATVSALVNLLEAQGRLDEAIVVYERWLGPTPEPSARAGYGNWLATNGRTEAAVTQLERALADDPLVPLGHTLLGVSLYRLDRYELAREHLELALLDDPEDEDAADALADVEAQVGRLPGPQKLQLQRRLDAWRRDAGVGAPR